MIVRLVLLGSGEDLDPYRVDLPSYSMVSQDIITMTATVSIPQRQAPVAPPTNDTSAWIWENGVPILYDLPSANVTAWWQKLASQYPNREPAYMPGFA